MLPQLDSPFEHPFDYPAELPAAHPDSHPFRAQRLVSPNLVSSNIVRLPKDVWNQAASIVKALHEYRQLTGIAPNYLSPSMSCDVHINSAGQLKIIEINTNASFLALSLPLYQAHGIPHPDRTNATQGFGLDEYVQLFKNSWQEFVNGSTKETKKQKPLGRIGILDDQPTQQKLYIEFLYAKALFESFGLQCKILDILETPGDLDLIYNRWTDFTFDSEVGKNWKAIYESEEICFTPNPAEYLALADKSQLTKLADSMYLQRINLSPDSTNTLRQHVLECFHVQTKDPDYIWQNRKNFFFKPLNSFGGKRVYRGDSIRKNKFAEILESADMMAQEWVPPSEFEFDGVRFKTDLRFYFYGDQLLTAVARLYQGQMTNLNTPNGGYAAIILE